MTQANKVVFCSFFDFVFIQLIIRWTIKIELQLWEHKKANQSGERKKRYKLKHKS